MNSPSIASPVTNSQRLFDWLRQDYILRPLCLFLMWRMAFFFFALLGLGISIENANFFDQFKYVDDRIFPNNYLLDAFFRWDSEWYATIMQYGYGFESGIQSNVVFYPLLPMLSKAFGYLFGSGYVGALFVVNASLLTGLMFMYRIALERFNRDVADYSVMFMLVFPASYYFSAFYTESLFFCTCAAAFYFFHKQKYFFAGMFGMLAMTSRSAGVVLIVAWGSELVWRIYRREIKLDWRMLGLLLNPTGMLLFMAVLFITVGDPIAFVEATNKGWKREFTLPPVTLYNAWEGIDFSFPRSWYNVLGFLNLISAVLFLVAAAFMVIRKYPLSMPAFVILGVCLPLTTGSTASIVRYCMVLFPVFIFLAEVTSRHKFLRPFVIYVFAMFMAVLSIHFMNGYPVD